MNIEFPVTITPPPIVYPDGTTKTVDPFDLYDVEFIFIDNPKQKTVSVRVHPLPKELYLWVGDEYDAIGDWTQEQVDEKINELIGEDPVAFLNSLF